MAQNLGKGKGQKCFVKVAEHKTRAQSNHIFQSLKSKILNPPKEKT